MVKNKSPQKSGRNREKREKPNSLSDGNWRIIQAALNQPPSLFELEIYRYQRQHKSRVLKELGSYVKIFEDNHELLAGSVQRINVLKKKGWKEHDTLQAMLLSKIPKALFSSFQQILQGDYDESLATTQIAYESALRICSIEKHPTDMWAVFAKPTAGQRKFQASNFMTQDAKVMKEDYIYSRLSCSVHTKLTPILELQNAVQKGRVELSLGYKFGREMLGLAFNHLIVVLYFAIRISLQLLEPMLEQNTQRDSLTSFKALDKFVRTLPNNRLAEFPNVLDKLLGQIS